MENYLEAINIAKHEGMLGMNPRSDMLIMPKQYIYTPEPFYKGDGEHSIKELQLLLNQYKEYSHQQAIIKQRLIEFIKQ